MVSDESENAAIQPLAIPSRVLQAHQAQLLLAAAHRLLVYRYRLQRGEFLRPSRLFPGRERSVQGAQNDAQSGDDPACCASSVLDDGQTGGYSGNEYPH
jgi:hypothetical protein